MVRRARSLLLIFGLIVTSLVLSISVGFAQAVGVTPGSAPPGTEITVFGDGFEPGEEITVSFGGIEVVTFADDEGSFTVSLTIDELMPPGMHPLDIDGSAGNFFSFEYLVEEPPPPTTTTTQPPTTTTTAASTTTAESATTTEAPTTTEAATTTAAPTTTVSDTSVPTTIVDDSRVSTSDGDGFPWWLFLIAILIALALGAGVMMAINNSNTAKTGTFSDTAGNQWEYCSGRCRVKYKTVTRTPSEGGRQVLVSAVPSRGNPCTGSGCGCVLFQNPAAGGSPILLDEDGGSVRRVGGVEYSARCVKKV